MPLVAFTAGQKLTAALLNAALDNVQRVSYQAADSSPANNTTAFIASAMSLSVVANASYVFETHIVYDTNTTADFKIQLLLPTGAATVVSSWGSTATVAAADSTIQHDASVLGATTTIVSVGGWGAIGNFNSCRLLGAILVGANAGNAVINFSQNTATAVNTVLKAGSVFKLTRTI